MGGIRRYEFDTVPVNDCDHRSGITICELCAAQWQADYEFGDDFPFERVPGMEVRTLIYAGKINVGDVLCYGEPGSRLTAVVTGTGEMMLSDGRIYRNPAAASHAIVRGAGDPAIGIMPN